MTDFIHDGENILYTFEFEVTTRNNLTPTPQVSRGFIDHCYQLQRRGITLHFMANCDLGDMAEALKPLRSYYSTANAGQLQQASDGTIFHNTLEGIDMKYLLDELAGLKEQYPVVEIIARGNGVYLWTGTAHLATHASVLEALEAKRDEWNAISDRWVIDSNMGGHWIHLNRMNAPSRDIRQPPIAFKYAILNDNAKVDEMPIGVYLTYSRYHAFLRLLERDELKHHKLAIAGSLGEHWGLVEYVAKNGGSATAVKEDGETHRGASGLDGPTNIVSGMEGLNNHLANLINEYGPWPAEPTG